MQSNTASQLLRSPSAPLKRYGEHTIVIPTLDEVGSIGELLRAISVLLPGATIIVADDGSTDGTCETVRLAEKQWEKRGEGRVVLLDRRADKTHGITASVLDALRACETEYFAVMDGDLQHPPEKLPAMFDALENGASVVVGCRASFPGDYSRVRNFVSGVAGRLARRRLDPAGVRINDPMSGFFASRSDLLRRAVNSDRSAFELAGYKVLFDFLKVFAADQNFSDEAENVQEIFYHFGARRFGSSKLRAAHIWHFLRAVFRR